MASLLPQPYRLRFTKALRTGKCSIPGLTEKNLREEPDGATPNLDNLLKLWFDKVEKLFDDLGDRGLSVGTKVDPKKHSSLLEANAATTYRTTDVEVIDLVTEAAIGMETATVAVAEAEEM